jgi:TM2 domain-containing membrane protein YozV
MPKAKKRAAPKRRAVPMPKAQAMPRMVRRPSRQNLGLAVAGLIINILLFPGLGSIIAGKTKTGLWQLLMMVIGIVFTLTVIGAIIGIPLMIVAWIWGIVTGVQAVKEAS